MSYRLTFCFFKACWLRHEAEAETLTTKAVGPSSHKMVKLCWVGSAKGGNHTISSTGSLTHCSGIDDRRVKPTKHIKPNPAYSTCSYQDRGVELWISPYVDGGLV